MAGIGGPLAVAVSGGGDSLALMHLAARHAAAHGRPAPVVLTVDHGLRKDSRADARKVAAWAKALGLKPHILSWPGRKPKTGVEAAARRARYRLMGAWMAANGVSVLCVGHTQDDQAETFLLRLARGSGVDGLAAMRTVAPWPEPGFAQLHVVRPLLALPRAGLRAFLGAVGQDWLDDPMNQDTAFDRVRLRQAARALAAAGLSAPRIAAAAAHLARARAALEEVTRAVLARAVRPAGKTQQDGLLVDAAALTGAPREVGLRALAAVLMTVSRASYRPRFEALERLFDKIAAGELGGGATLMGCRLGPARDGRRGGAAAVLLVRREGPRAGSRAPDAPAGRRGSQTAP
jgi:tRNA(Ile)-lysidine synthase